VSCSGHHGYQRARSDLWTGLNGPFGSPVLACAGKTVPPSRSRPLADLGGLGGYIIACSSSRAVVAVGDCPEVPSRPCSTIKRVGRLRLRSSSPRSFGHVQERSRRCGPAYWRAQWRVRYGEADRQRSRTSGRITPGPIRLPIGGTGRSTCDTSTSRRRTSLPRSSDRA
jgi:hypothetical protein